jgi:uncharacterized membrane protein
MLRLVRIRRTLLESLWFLPAAILLGLGGLAFGLLEIDRSAAPDGSFVFGGDGAAARTVLSVLAGSLITVAGLSLSLTVLVLQLASSQFSPRVLPSVLADRLTQATVGAFVGIFAFALIALRSVGSGFVPRLTVTVASGLGLTAVILLVVFIHHVSSLIQVSSIAARLGRDTLARLESLYPEPFGAAAEDDPAPLLATWYTSGEPVAVRPEIPGYVDDVNLALLARRLEDLRARVHLTVVPGDFVTPGDVIARVWDVDGERACAAARAAVTVADERSLASDLAFGVRQLADVALRALSPSLNDPTTARTCIGYLRAVLEGLARRDLPARMRRFGRREALVVAERREFEHYLEPLAEIARFASPSAEVLRDLQDTFESVALHAEAAGARNRADAARRLAATLQAEAARAA